MFNSSKNVVISLDESVGLMSEADEVKKSVETESLTCIELSHPKFGNMTIVQSASSSECLALQR